MNELFDVELFPVELFPVELSEDELFSEAAFCAAVHDMELSGIDYRRLAMNYFRLNY